MKKYTTIGLVQLSIVLLFSIVVYFMFKIENIILNPIPYTLSLGILFIALDLVILIYLFKEHKDKDEYTEMSDITKVKE